MEVTVNGQVRELTPGSTLLDLLQQLNVNRQHVAVEWNGRLIPREQHGECRLAAGDRLEIVTLVGGG